MATSAAEREARRRAYWRERNAQRAARRRLWPKNYAVRKNWTRTPPHATHIAGYVPPKGSIAMAFVGRVVWPLDRLGL